MKKFEFSLETVLAYKQQVLDALQGEHAAAMAKTRQQEEILNAVTARYQAYSQEYNQRKHVGLTVSEAQIYQGGLRVLEAQIARETERLAELRKQEEKKRAQMVEAKKEVSSIEKVKEKKLKLYQKAAQKNEESRVEEFVSAARIGNLA